MEVEAWKSLMCLALCFSLVNSQFTTTDLPLEPDEPDSALIAQYNLTSYGAANVDYGQFAYHRKFIPSSTHNFSYDENHPRGPSSWASTWPLCGGANQSPIDIPASQCTPQTATTRLQYFNSRVLPSNVIIENNGYSIEYLFQYPSTPLLFGGPLTEAYLFEFIHFHWGLNDNEGSENALDGVKYDLEMHAGHRNAKYSNLTEAAQYSDGLVVLSFLYQVSDTASDSPRLAPLRNVTAINTRVVLSDPPNYAIADFVGSLAQEEILNYRGSLTTPPCSPANWLVASAVRDVSRNDLEMFRQTRKERGTIAPNFRPLTQRNGRGCSSYKP